VSDPRRSSPAALRNRGAILEILRAHLPHRGTVLEIASGTGEHAVYFAQNLPTLIWQPSDLDAANRLSVAAYRADAKLANLCAPVALDTCGDWPALSADAIFCANMIHIAPFEAALGLLAGARRLLGEGAPLILYGPYFEAGKSPAPSNVAFDEDLRRRNAAWGIRTLEDISKAAAGFDAPLRIEMPANNLCLVFRRNGL
jgi:hypothetical protein